MNDQRELEALLESAFRGGALPSAPASLVATLEAVPSKPVTHGAAVRRAGRGRPWSGALGVAAVLLIGGALALSIGGPGPLPVVTPSPSDAVSQPTPTVQAPPPAGSPSTAVASSFVSPFEYTIPAGTVANQVIAEREIIGWVEGSITPRSSGEPVLRYSDRQSGADATEGIVIASGEHAWSHGSTGRFAVRQAPADLLADLRDTAAVGIGEISDVTLDGRPALMAEIDPAENRGSDLHITGDMCCISGEYIMLNVPSRILVLEVGEVTILIQTWARTADDLAAWMPAATEFVDSIRFTEGR